MRKMLTAGTALLGVACFVAPASAQAPATPVRNSAGLVQMTPVTPPKQEPPPDLALGEDLAVACDAIERVADPSDVRVVLTIAAIPGDTSPGYKKIMAIDEKVTGSAVHLKVPNAPDLANHTVNLNVYVVDGGRNNDCNGGQYRIVQTSPPPPPPKTPG
jgi:hypothetical protein